MICIPSCVCMRCLVSGIAQSYFDLEEAGGIIHPDAVVSILKNPLANDRIASGKLRMALDDLYGQETRVRAQDLTNFQIGTVHGAPELGEMKLYIVYT